MPITIKPFKFEHITFEVKYDRQHIDIFNFITNILGNKRAIEKIHIIPNMVEQINEKIVKKLMIESIHGTLAIEGNPSTENEIKRIVSSEDQKKYKEQKDIETFNIKQAYNFINDHKRQGKEERIIISEELIKEMHQIITDRTFVNGNVPGQYRNFEVKVGNDKYGGVYRPPHTLDDIKILMRGFVEWINSAEVIKENPIIRAIVTHYFFEIIHPFGDGNGRVGRGLESLILHDYGFKYGSSFALWGSYYANYEKYFSLISRSHKENKGNLTEFITFVLFLLNQALENMFAAIVEITDNLLFKDYLLLLLKAKKINNRQYLIVELIAEKNIMPQEELTAHPIVSMLYKRLTSRTYNRDLKQLIEEHKLILKKNTDSGFTYHPNIEGLLNKYDNN